MRKTMYRLSIFLVVSFLAHEGTASESRSKVGSVNLPGIVLKIKLSTYRGISKEKNTGAKKVNTLRRGDFNIILQNGNELGKMSHIIYKGKKYYFINNKDKTSKFYRKSASIKISNELGYYSTHFGFKLNYVLKDKSGKTKTFQEDIMVFDERGKRYDPDLVSYIRIVPKLK